MEKLVFVFRRKAGLTRDDFHAHYVANHSPLGLRRQKGLSGYTVNHLQSDAEFDTVTEIWTPSAAAFTGGGDPDPEIVADHLSFMGPQDCYLVAERIVRDGPLDAPADRPGTRRKVVSFHARADSLPPVADEAVRVVDNVVRRQIYAHDRPVAPNAASPVAVIRTAWFDGTDSEAGDGFAVREYRYRAAEEAAA